MWLVTRAEGHGEASLRVPSTKVAWPKLELIHRNEIIINLKEIILIRCFFFELWVTNLILEKIFDAQNFQ